MPPSSAFPPAHACAFGLSRGPVVKDYILSDSAHADLEGIAEYYMPLRPEYLEVLLSELERKFHLVGRNPNLGTASSHLLEGLRRTVVRNYVIFYRFIAGRTVISRIVHGARDIDASFFE